MESGNVADWFSAVGTVFAAVSALYIALRKPKSNMMFMHHFDKRRGHTGITGINTGKAPSEIRVIGVQYWFGKKDTFRVPKAYYDTKKLSYSPNGVNLGMIITIDNDLPGICIRVQLLDEIVAKRYDCFLKKEEDVWVPYKIKKTNTLPEIRNKYPYNKFWARFSR